MSVDPGGMANVLLISGYYGERPCPKPCIQLPPPQPPPPPGRFPLAPP